MAAATELDVRQEDCSAKTCGGVTILEPFGLVVPEQANETTCGRLGFKVSCANNTPYLGYYRVRFKILHIFYENGSLLVVDTHKLKALNSSSHRWCRIPRISTSTKVGVPFSISPENRNLVFYNCTKAPSSAERGLVQTKCGNNSFVHMGGSYNGPGDYDSYSLEGCNSTIVPVLGDASKVNASSYEKLISDGFLLTWQPSPAGKFTHGTVKMS